MHNIVPSVLVYFFETLISYVFFSRVSKSKYKLCKAVLIGSGIFFIGAIINIIFKNSILKRAEIEKMAISSVAHIKALDNTE